MATDNIRREAEALAKRNAINFPESRTLARGLLDAFDHLDILVRRLDDQHKADCTINERVTEVIGRLDDKVSGLAAIHGYIDKLAERVCALEDRNEYASKRFASLAHLFHVDGPEAGVPMPDLSEGGDAWQEAYDQGNRDAVAHMAGTLYGMGHRPEGQS